MSDRNTSARNTPARSIEQEFAVQIRNTAVKQLQARLGDEAGKKAAQSVTMAFLSAMRTAKNPEDFLACTPASIADCVATSLDTELYPGGPNPTVYLVPQRPRRDAPMELQWRITHRGLGILASRAGFGIFPVPVGVDDHLRVSFGEAVEHRADPTAWPDSLDNMLGVILVVRRISDGAVICRPWVPRGLIEKRRATSRMSNYGPWKDWPVEMAQKTAIQWACARGLVPMDSPELRAALEADVRGDVIDADDIPAPAQTRARGKAALAEPVEQHALPDHGDIPDLEEEREREPVKVRASKKADVIDDEAPL